MARTSDVDYSGLGQISTSLLSILQDCPFCDYDSLQCLQGSAILYNTIARLKKAGLVQTVSASEVDVIHFRKLLMITPKGRTALNEVLSVGKFKGMDSGDEDPVARVYIPSRILVTGQSSSGVKTHFNRVHLVRFWLQLRYLRFTRFSVLWDFVKHPGAIPLLGNPDIVLYNRIDLQAGLMKGLVIVEWEFSKKASHTIFDRLNELTKNTEAVFFLIVSDKMDLLKRYANVVRKGVPGSSYFSGKKTFSSNFINNDFHLKRLWFVHWNPSEFQVTNSGVDEATCYRFDHEVFDIWGPFREGAEGKKVREILPFQRFKGRTEFKLSEIMKVVHE